MTILEAEHVINLKNSFEKINADIGYLNRIYGNKIPMDLIEEKIRDMNNGAIDLQPLSDVRVSIAAFMLIPTWAAKHIILFEHRIRKWNNDPRTKAS